MSATVYPFPPQPEHVPAADNPAPADHAPSTGEGSVYTVKEVSQYLRLSLGGTYALIRSGEIPARKLGGRWVIPKRRFAAWLDSCETAPVEAPVPPRRRGR